LTVLASSLGSTSVLRMRSLKKLRLLRRIIMKHTGDYRRNDRNQQLVFKEMRMCDKRIALFKNVIAWKADSL
jgi:hypothetical protein